MINSPEIVQHDWTKAPIETILFNQIILLHWNNINRKNKGEITPWIVQRLWTLVSGKRSGPISKYIHDQVVFTVSAIPRNEEWPKSTVYQVVSEHEKIGIVEKTLYKVVNPDPSYSGPKARFYKIKGYEIRDGWKDPYLIRAQEYYSASISLTPEAELESSNRARLNAISTIALVYFKERHEFGGNWTPKIEVIKQYIGDKNPEYDSKFITKAAIEVQNKLFKTKKVLR